jgi:hypothetical protein
MMTFNEYSNQGLLWHLLGAPAGAGQALCACAGSKPVAPAFPYFILLPRLSVPFTAYKGGDPRQKFTVPPFPLHVASAHPTFSYVASVHSALHPSVLAIV